MGVTFDVLAWILPIVSIVLKACGIVIDDRRGGEGLLHPKGTFWLPESPFFKEDVPMNGFRKTAIALTMVACLFLTWGDTLLAVPSPYLTMENASLV